MTLIDIATELLIRADLPGDTPKLVLGDETQSWPEGAVRSLAELGLLEPTGSQSRVSCTECDEPHSETVTFGEDGAPAYIYCPLNGRVELDAILLKRWRISIEGIAAQLVRVLETGRTPREAMRGRHWSLGSSQGLEVHLLRGVGWPDAPALFAPSGGRKQALFVVLSEDVPQWLAGRVCSLPAMLREQDARLSVEIPEFGRLETLPGYALVKSGQHWTATWTGVSKTVRNYVGLAYLSHLLANPGKRIGALELLALSGPSAGSLPSHDDELRIDEMESDQVIDTDARRDYQRRIAELDARKRSGLLSNEEQDELSSLQKQLRQVIGLGSRPRRVQGPAEKARTSISHALDRVEDQLADILPALASHLKHSVKRGASFSYEPEEAIEWKITT